METSVRKRLALHEGARRAEGFFGIQPIVDRNVLLGRPDVRRDRGFRGASGHASEHLASRNEKSRSAAKIRANLSGAAAQETGIDGDHFPSFRRRAPVARPDFLDEGTRVERARSVERVQCEHPRDALADLLAQKLEPPRGRLFGAICGLLQISRSEFGVGAERQSADERERDDELL